MNSFNIQCLSLSTTLDISFTYHTTLMDNTFLDYKCSMVRVKLFLPYLPSNKLLLRLLLLLNSVLSNSEPTYLHSDLSDFLQLSTKRDHLPRSLEASNSCYIPKPTFADSVQAIQLPFLASFPRHLNFLPYTCYYYFM